MTALIRRLAAYSASAAAAFAAAPGAEAQVVYHDLDPDLYFTGWNQFIPLDLYGDGEADFRLRDIRTNTGGHEWLFFEPAPGADPRNAFLGYRRWHHYGPGEGLVSRLASASSVGPQDDPARWLSTQAFIAVGICSDSCPFADEDGYAGFRFVGGDGQLLYGWARLASPRASFYLAATIYEYAYERSPDTPIPAGYRGLATLEGVLDQTTFPDAGCVLHYAFVLANTSGEARTIDLWVDAQRDGAPAFTQHLGAYTLADGAAVADTAAVEIDADLPAGLYTLTFKAGTFAAPPLLASEAFEITKGATTAAEPEPGAASHALSEPVPNPTGGTAGLTLTVATPQRASVEVLDALGRRVALLHDGVFAAGEAHRLVFDGSALPAGVYVVRAVGEAFMDVRVLTLTR